MRFVRFSVAALLTVTQLFVPLNDKALPYLPVVQVVFRVVPLLSKPEASNTVVPLFSLNPSASTSPFDGAGVLVRVGVGVDVLVGSAVLVAVGVRVGVGSAVPVPVGVAVDVRVGVGVLVGSAVLA